MTKFTSLFVLAFASLALACGGSSPPATAKDFCLQSDSLGCDKVFQCVPAAGRDASFVSMFGNSVSECKGMSAADCADANTTCTTYDSAKAQACLDKVAPLTCDQIIGAALPAECDQACP